MFADLTFNDKPLEQLSLEETIEFEKQLLKRVVGANRADMSQNIIDQLMGFVEQVRMHKKEKVGEMRANSMRPKAKEIVEEKIDEGLIIGEIEPIQTDDPE